VKACERVLSGDSVLSGAHVEASKATPKSWSWDPSILEDAPCLKPWVGVVRLFEFGKNHGLVLYGYLNLERTVGWCCKVIWIWKEPWVGVVRLFEFGKNHGLVLYGYLNLERTTAWCSMVIWNFKEPWVGVLWLFGFWKNHGLVLYGYLNFERTMGFIFFIIAKSNNCPFRFFETSVEMKEPWVPAISKSLWLVKKGWS